MSHKVEKQPIVPSVPGLPCFSHVTYAFNLCVGNLGEFGLELRLGQSIPQLDSMKS